MKLKFLIILIGLSSFVCAERVRLNLDTDWKFHPGEQPEAQNSQFDDSAWRSLDLPHDWSIECAFSQTNSPRNAWLPGGIGWYRKTLTIPASRKGSRVELQFDGVYKHAQVWVNGSPVGKQYDGYTSFHVDITPQVAFGRKNLIAVRVDNSVQPNCRWYTGSGIYRKVWLNITDPLHVATWGTAITTPGITDQKATVHISTTITEGRRAVAGCTLETTLLNPDGRPVTSVTSPINTDVVEQTMQIDQPERWSLDTPQRYTAISRVKRDGKTVDQYSSPFGIRSIRFDARKGFFLNGKNMKMKGVCLHAEAGTFGAAIPVDVWEYRLTGLKAAGCNAIRTAHNPAAPEFLDLCDRMGFLVMDEFVDKWDDPVFADPFFHTEWKKNFKNTIRRDRNHPSVVIWSVGNENHQPGSPEQTDSLETYCNFVRTVDATRPVISGMMRGKDKDPEQKVDDILTSTKAMDLIGMNYGLQWSHRIARRNPGKAFISTESLPYFSHTETKIWSHIERHDWFDVIENDSNIGLFIWSGIKYLGEIPKKGNESWPNILCWPSSILDTAGFRQDLSYFYQAIWTDKPMVHIAVYEKDPVYKKNWGSPPTHSMWNRAQGTKADLVTYTNCESVELYLNGRRIGSRALSDFPNAIMKWPDIPFEPGTIKAVGFRNGKAVCEFELHSADSPESIQLTASQHGELTFITAQLFDHSGNPVQQEERPLRFNVKNGTVLSLDNGALTAMDRLQEKSNRDTLNGRCLAVVKADSSGMDMTMTVQSPGLTGASITLP